MLSQTAAPAAKNGGWIRVAANPASTLLLGASHARKLALGPLRRGVNQLDSPRDEDVGIFCAYFHSINTCSQALCWPEWKLFMVSSWISLDLGRA